MVATRIQSGTIEVLKYDQLTLRLRGEGDLQPGSTSTKIKKTLRINSSNGRNRGKRGTTVPRSKSRSPKEKAELQKMVNELKEDEKTSSSLLKKNSKERTVTENFFWPKVAFGEGGEGGLSAIGRADLEILQWKKILETHKQHLPDAVPHIKHQLKLAKARHISLNADPANHLARTEEKRAAVVQKHIKELEYILATSEFELEGKNIKAAIAGYRSGEIAYSRQYTLIWAGQIVGKADSYAEFTRDRLGRLDGYEKKYGSGWLRWESPLWLHSHERITSMSCQIVGRDESLGFPFRGYEMNQGFWKRSDWVKRLPADWSLGAVGSDDCASFQTRGDPEETYCYLPAPKIIFKSTLDSGLPIRVSYLAISKPWVSINGSMAPRVLP